MRAGRITNVFTQEEPLIPSRQVREDMVRPDEPKPQLARGRSSRRWDDLPPNVQIEILKLLDKKSLIRCMSICTSMFSAVTSPSLMVSRSDLNPPQLPSYHIFSYSSGGNQWFFLCKDADNNNNNDEEFEQVNNKTVCSPVDPTYFLIGSCEGLMCFSNHLHSHPKFVIWNPFLGMYLTLPMAPLSGYEREYELGFGFDRSHLEYKFVRVGILPSNAIWADVYTVSSVTWKRLLGSISGADSRQSRVMGQGVFVDDCIHWVLCSNDEDYSILTFNLTKEVFGEIIIPDKIEADRRTITLTKFTMGGKEKLVLYTLDHICNVWVMEEDGVWNKVCAIDVGKNDYAKVLCARANGEIIGCTVFNKRLFSYDPETRVVSYNVAIDKHKSQLEYVGPLVRNLVFPGEYRRAVYCKGFRLEEEEEVIEDVKVSSEDTVVLVEDDNLVTLLEEIIIQDLADFNDPY